MNSVSCYTITNPGTVHFGCGTRRMAIQAITDQLPNDRPRVFLVASGGALRSAAGGELLEMLQSQFDLQTATDIPHDPPLECVSVLIAAMRSSKRNVVVAQAVAVLWMQLKPRRFCTKVMAVWLTISTALGHFRRVHCR